MDVRLTRGVLCFVLVVAVLSGGRADATTIGCGSTIRRNTTLHADITGCGSGGLVIGRSRITLNLNGHTIGGNNSGVGISVNSSHVTIENGTVRSFATGVSGVGRRVTIKHLALFGNVDGLFWTGSRTTVQDTRLYSNGDRGAVLGLGGSGNRFVRDTFIGNANGGAYITSPATFSDSFFTGNGGTGALVLSGGDGTVFSSDRFNDNVSHGAYAVGANAVTFTNNIANFNGAWGIDADPSVIDGGGNAARGNGQSAQCVNVSCA